MERKNEKRRESKKKEKVEIEKEGKVEKKE